MIPSFNVHYCVPPENRFLIAQIYYENQHWAELNSECGHLEIQLFSRPCGQPWAIPFADAMNALQTAESEIKRRSVFFEEPMK